jgi:hypothetical protein
VAPKLGVAGTQYPAIHRKGDIRAAIQVVARVPVEQSSRPLQPLVEAGPWNGLMQPDHCRHDPGALYEFHQSVEHRRRIGVEPEDEATLHLQTCSLHPLDVGFQVASQVVALATLRQALWAGSLDPHEHHVEAHADHGRHQIGIVSEVDRSLGVELEAWPELAALQQRGQ